MTIKTIDHNKFIDRIYDILTQDAELIKKINKKNIVKYNPPSPRSGGRGVALPYMYITEAPNPVIQEKVVGRGNPPIQMLSLQYWVVIAVQSTKGANTQKTLTEYIQILERIFNEHPYLQYVANDLGVRRVRCKSVDKSEGAIGKPRQAKNLMVTVDVMYTPTNAPFSFGTLTGERSHTTDPAEATAIINDGNDGSIAPDGSTRPFTSIPLPLQESAELQTSGNGYDFGSSQPYTIYVNKDADAEFEITITGEYAGSGSPLTRVYNRSPVDGIMTIDDGNWDSVNRISTKVTSITGATTIDFAGVRFKSDQRVAIFTNVVAVTESEFPFDHDVNTSVGLAVGTYFFPQLGRKELESIIVSSQDTDPISITVSTSVDGVDYTQEGVIEALVNTPTTYNFNKIFQEFAFVKFVAMKAFRLHELTVLGQT